MTSSDQPNDDAPATDTVNGEVASPTPSPLEGGPQRAAEALERNVTPPARDDYGPEGPKANAEPVDDRRIDGVYIDHVKRLGWVLKYKLKLVVAANMFFEDETGILNEAGQSNLTEALSHIGTIFEGAEKLTYSDQAHEVHEMEDHLRRSMMESYELVYRQHMGDVEKAWEQYDELVRPLLEEGVVSGLPPIAKVEALRRKCKRLVLEGRECKRAHSWTEWEKGTNCLVAACKVQDELLHELNAAIRIAQQHAANEEARERADEARDMTRTETNRGIRFTKKMTALTAVFSVLLVGVGWGLSELTSGDSKQKTPVAKPAPLSSSSSSSSSSSASRSSFSFCSRASRPPGTTRRRSTPGRNSAPASTDRHGGQVPDVAVGELIPVRTIVTFS